MSWLRTLRLLWTVGRGVATGGPRRLHATDPMVTFDWWFSDAKAAGLALPEAMTVATATPDGAPSARTMLLKGVDAHGFVFFTHFDGRKGAELDANPRAALTFHWAVLQRQVRVEGPVARVPDGASDAYFRTRSRGSQIGAWASRQSRALESRGVLEERVRSLEERFRGAEVPRPPGWGGYRLSPVMVEFWQGRLYRLHDRWCYRRVEDGWARERLYP